VTSTTVLIADDHDDMRQGIRRLLEQEGKFTVVGEADDGEQAVELTSSKKPDVVVMDIAMPKLNGFEATRQIKSLFPATAVLILSSYDDDEYVFGLLDMGVAGYLLKSVTGDELVRAVEAVSKGDAVLDPAISSKVNKRFQSNLTVASDGQQYGPLGTDEVKILKMAAAGIHNQEIASQMMIGEHEVESSMKDICSKLGVASRTEAVIYGLKKGWFATEELQ
jgi:two-component system, NarL family, response regulator LiaR